MAAQELFTTTLYTDPTLISYYRLEDTSDSKGGHTLTNTGSVTFTTGKFGNGANFGVSNTTKLLSVASPTYLPTGDFTYMLWFNTAATIAGGFFIASNGAGGDGITLRMNSNTELQGRIMNNSTAVMDLDKTGLTAFNDSVWHHFGFTRIGTACAIYLDGVSILTGSSTGNPNFSVSNPLYIGALDNGTANFSGLMDELAIFSSGLSSTVMSQVFNGGLPLNATGIIGSDI